MRVEQYQELARELGIDRGQFESGFKPDLPGVVPQEDGPAVNHAISKRVAPPPITEDLSRFANKGGRGGLGLSWEERRRRMLRACKKETLPFYRSLVERGLTLELLAKQCRISAPVLHHAVSGHYVSRLTIAKVYPHLTEMERRILKWPSARRKIERRLRSAAA